MTSGRRQVWLRESAHLARYAGRTTADAVRYCLHTGRWWVPVVAVVLAVITLAALTAKAVAPVAVYTFF